MYGFSVLFCLPTAREQRAVGRDRHGDPPAHRRGVRRRSRLRQRRGAADRERPVALLPAAGRRGRGPLTMGELIEAGDVELWVEQRGEGPDVLLIAGLGDVAEAWEAQLDALSSRYRVTAFDNRDVGRATITREPFTVATLADDAAALLGALGIGSAHVAGFSMGGAIAQELGAAPPRGREDARARTGPTRGPTRTCRRCGGTSAPGPRSPQASRRSSRDSSSGSTRHAPTPTAPSRRSSTRRARSRTSSRSRRSSVRSTRARVTTRTTGSRRSASRRSSSQAAPTWCCPPHVGRAVAEAIPGAEFVLLPGEAHQPFQEVPAEWNALVDAFWSAACRST